MKNLSKKEKEVIKEILLEFGKMIYRDSGMSHFSGGYAKANMDGFDDNTIYITTEFGEHNADGVTKYIDEYSMPRSVLHKDETIAQKIKTIKITD